MTTRYITSPAAGNGSGDSWANGAAIHKIAALLAASDPRDEIHIEGGRVHVGGVPPLTSTRLVGATAETRVGLYGVNPADGVPAHAVLEDVIRPDPWVTGGVQGARYFEMEAGIRFLHLSCLIFRRHNEVIHFRHADNTGFLIEDCEFENVSHAIAQASALCPAVTHSTFRRLAGRGWTGNFLLFMGDSHDLLFEDIDGDAEYNDDGQLGKWSNGSNLWGTAHDITHRRVDFRNGGGQEGSAYWNGDGFVTDESNSRLTYDDVKASGWLDAGLDLKSSQTVVLDSESADNKRNWRFHQAGDYELHRIRSLRPNKRGGSGTQDHFQLSYNATLSSFPRTEVHVYDAFLDDDDPATNISAHAGEATLLTFHRGRIKKPAASPLSTHPDRTVFDQTRVEIQPEAA